MNHLLLVGQPKASHARVVALFKGASVQAHPFLAGLSSRDKDYVSRIRKTFKADILDSEKIVLPDEKGSVVLLIGLGEKKSWTLRKLVKAARKVVNGAKGAKLPKLAIHTDDWVVEKQGYEKSLETFVINAEMADYEFKKYLETPKEGWPAVDEIAYTLSRAGQRQKITNALFAGKQIGDATSLARELANTPGGDMTPSMLASAAKKAVKDMDVAVTLLGEKEMRKLKMGGMLGVSRGSKEEAQLIIMEYAPSGTRTQKPIVMIGKGITFDSGGLNLKPSSSMDEMHMDMSGGASVIAAMRAIASLKVKNRVLGIIPAVENMPSGESYRPGDVLRSMSGKTIEVVSTDAEGRVVLADAMTYAERYAPRLVVDVATLTGACSVALGRHASALLTPNEKLEHDLRAIGEASGDYLWPLPMWEEYEQDVKGAIGDVLNAGRKREAGTIDGGMFLYQFAKKFLLWAHIDIASTMTTSPDQLLSKGASGTSVRFLVEIARTWK